jgi:signal transduction histidine kinase
MSSAGTPVAAASPSARAQLGRYGEPVLLAGLYYAAARFGYLLEFSGPVASIIWLPAGVGIAFLSLRGLWLWPAVVIADLFIDHHEALPLDTALLTTLGNTLEVVLAAWLIRRSLRHGPALGNSARVLELLGALGLGTAVSATIGVGASWLGGLTSFDQSATVWRTWWLGDLLGALIVVPVALTWAGRHAAPPWRGRALEGIALVAVGGSLSVIALHGSKPLPPIVFPVLIWAALRFGVRGATLAVAAISLTAVINVTHYHGPFVYGSVDRTVLATQLFIAIAAITTMFLRAVVSEREELAERVAESRARLVDASDRERRRLERDLHDGAQQRLVALSILLHRVRSQPELLDAAEAETQVAIQELRELAAGLHPSVLTDFGLRHALRGFALRADVAVTVHDDLPDGRFDPRVEAAAYYVAAEAVTNALKHAGATHITLTADCHGGKLRLRIADDGIGGAVERSQGGLEGLRDRVEAVGGTFHVVQLVPTGTAVSALLPL